MQHSSKNPYLPFLYSLLTENINYDLSHYLDHTQQHGGPVLEIGVGLGRIFLPLAELGIPIYGIDSASVMLETLQQNPLTQQPHCTLLQADMTDFQLEQLFQTILVPLRTFHLLENATLRNQCLQTCSDHLLPGGQILLHLTERTPHAQDSSWKIIMERSTINLGWLTVEESMLTTSNRSIVLLHRFQEYDQDGLFVRSWLLRHPIYLFTIDDINLSPFGLTISEKRSLGADEHLVILSKDQQ